MPKSPVTVTERPNGVRSAGSRIGKGGRENEREHTGKPYPQSIGTGCGCIWSGGYVRKIQWDLSSEAAVTNFLAFVSQLRLAGKRPVFMQAPEKRSLDQNSMIYALYEQIASQAQDQSVSDVRRECKLRHGVPILRAENEKFKALYDRCMKGTLTYEEKLEAMDILPVTRLMTKEQGTAYIDSIIREYSKQGYSLTSPSEEAA